MRIGFIRHGETEWSRAGRHTGRTDVPLTAHGLEQAAALGGRLRTIGFTRAVTSPLARARLTCERAALGVPMTVDPDLVEWNYGAYEGKTSAEIFAERPGWELFRDGCPGGESPDQAAARADRVLARLRGLPQPVAVFSHGHFLRMLAVRWLGWPLFAGKNLGLDTASFGLLDQDPHHPDTPTLERWNCV